MQVFRIITQGKTKRSILAYLIPIDQLISTRPTSLLLILQAHITPYDLIPYPEDISAFILTTNSTDYKPYRKGIVSLIII